MADITSPIALDESFNTTETTPRNIADVVADETGDLVTQAQAIVAKLQGIISAVKPDASDIPLDPITGMSANNVQLGISELKGTFTNYDFAKETVRRVVISSSQQGNIQFMNSYFSFLVLGFAQGVGGIAIVGKASNGALTVNDLLTGSTWSNSALTFALDSAKTKLIVTSNQTAESRLTFICGNITS